MDDLGGDENLSQHAAYQQYLRALELHRKGDLAAAKLLYEGVLNTNPLNADVLHVLGVVLAQQGDQSAALDFFDKAISIKPSDALFYINQGNARLELNRFDAAVISYDKALALGGGSPDLYAKRGMALHKIKRIEQAIDSYQKAIDGGMVQAELFNNLGNVYLMVERYEAALDCFEQVVKIKPNYEYLFGLLLQTRMRLCQWDTYQFDIDRLCHRIARGERVSTCFAALTLIDDLDLHHKNALIWVNDYHQPNPSLGLIKKLPKKQRIRIGYYSADMHNHATMWLMAGLFEHHDRDRFELIAFSYGIGKHDEMRDRICRAFDHFMDVTHKTDEEVAKISRSWDIDIAVDLKGLTGQARLGVFAYRAAPIQVSYLGYPGTLGAEYMDYLIADRTLIAEASKPYFSEKIAYLPGSYQVNDRKRKISERVFTKADVELPERGFVFCCFNNNYKITPDVFDTWVRILTAVPGSVLWLYQDNPAAADNLRKEAVRRGLDYRRLVFAAKIELSEHLARHRLADLFLDTIPCNAHTTASDALWSGLPVLTRIGQSFASRVAASLLHAIGLPELITLTESEYEAMAIELATHPEKLKAIKLKLEQNRLTMPLFDTERYTRNLEAAYVAMYERYQADLPPDHIAITDR